MDDLSALDWSKPGGGQPKPPPPNPPMPSMRPTPSPLMPGRGAPPPSQSSAAPPPKPRAPTKPAQDSFSNLVSFGPTRASQNLTLAERQAQLEAERRKKEEEQRKQSEAQFGSGQQWDALGSRAFAPSPSLGQPAPSSAQGDDDDDDLFAAFNKDTKVDKASHYPPPSSDRSTPASGNRLDLSDPSAWNRTARANGSALAAEDDDPFGLKELRPSARPPGPAVPKTVAEDDDFLGDLGRPVDEVRKRQQEAPQSEPGKPIELDDSSSSEEEQQPRRTRPTLNTKGGDPDFDKALAQLVDYGFSPEDAMRGLTQSGRGANASAAANWLLDEAHRKAKQKSQGRSPSAGPGRASAEMDAGPAAARGDSREADFTMSAAAMGNTLFKTANSLWKTGQKRMQQAVAEFQQEGDTGRPRWMREVQQGRPSGPGEAGPARPTDEALALESGGNPGPADAASRRAREPRVAPEPARGTWSAPSSGSQSRSSPAPRWQQQPKPPAMSDARSRLQRLAADDNDNFSSHVSANRRKKPATPPGEPSMPGAEPEDLLFSPQAPKPSRPLPQRPAQRPAQRPVQREGAAPAPTAAPARPVRQVPSIEPAALQASTRHRLQGKAHFKRGDFATAHSSYSSSICTVPATHPLMIVLLTNRALTALKTGAPKQAVTDADEALKLIGPARGQGEVVAVQGEDGLEEKRDMKELYGKALSRKAEALEQMERWADAGAVWQLCVEGGVGGATAGKGRQRCQDALAPKPKAAPKPRPRPSAAASLAPARDSAAVARLREANEAAAREDDEKFALAEQVEARVSAWRDGKRDNLRALLGSLDKVLWANSGWKGVGMHELVMANKVKIVYMKAIAKTHPDKLPQDAGTEVRLVAGLVFSTLNESWDRFKADNGL